MSDLVYAECAGIQANVDNKRADLVKYELDLGSGADINKNFPLNDSQFDEQRSLFEEDDNSSIYELSRKTYISQSICRETRASHPPRVLGHKAGNEV